MTSQPYSTLESYVILGQPTCTYCTKAKSLLIEKKLPVVYIDLLEEPWVLSLLKQAFLKTVPQIFSPEGHHIGGYEDLVDYLKKLEGASE